MQAALREEEYCSPEVRIKFSTLEVQAEVLAAPREEEYCSPEVQIEFPTRRGIFSPGGVISIEILTIEVCVRGVILILFPPS